MSTDLGSAGYSTRPGAPPPQQGSAEGIGSMLGGLLKDLQDLVRGEVALAKAEIKEDVSTATKGVAALATAAFFGLTGFIFLMLGLTYLLNIWMRMWIAAAIVGAVLMVIAAVLGISGKNKLSRSSLKPDQTIDSLKEDQQWAKEQISSVKR
jgi:uncharacterized membrane protein YqjE